jgi:hypothetical protein
MLLQNMDKENGHRLKRVILIGDHNQLPPVVKNRAFQKYSHLGTIDFITAVPYHCSCSHTPLSDFLL